MPVCLQNTVEVFTIFGNIGSFGAKISMFRMKLCSRVMLEV